MEIKKSDLGTYRIESNAFKSIAEIATRKIKYVTPAKKSDSVNCKIGKNGDLSLTISVRMKQGCDVIKTCKDLQDSIYETIEMMTSVACKSINIDIQGFY